MEILLYFYLLRAPSTHMLLHLPFELVATLGIGCLFFECIITEPWPSISSSPCVDRVFLMPFVIKEPTICVIGFVT